MREEINLVKHFLQIQSLSENWFRIENPGILWNITNRDDFTLIDKIAQSNLYPRVIDWGIDYLIKLLELSRDDIDDERKLWKLTAMATVLSVPKLYRATTPMGSTFSRRSCQQTPSCLSTDQGLSN